MTFDETLDLTAEVSSSVNRMSGNLHCQLHCHMQGEDLAANICLPSGACTFDVHQV